MALVCADGSLIIIKLNNARNWSEFVMRQGVHIFHAFPTFDPGGPQVRVCQIINAAPQYWRHTIMTMDHRTSAKDLISEGAKVNFLYPKAKKYDPLFILQLSRKLRILRPDLIVTYNWGSIETIISARLTNLKKIIHWEYRS